MAAILKVESSTSIAGNPTAADLAKARTYIMPDEQILGVFRMERGHAASVKAVLRDAGQPVFCFWFPPVVVCYPCICTLLFLTKAAAEETLYVVTTTHIHRIGHGAVAARCGMPFHTKIDHADVNTVMVGASPWRDNPGNPTCDVSTVCGDVCKPSGVLLLTEPLKTTETIADFSAQRKQGLVRLMDIAFIHTGEPEALEALINRKPEELRAMVGVPGLLGSAEAAVPAVVMERA